MPELDSPEKQTEHTFSVIPDERERAALVREATPRKLLADILLCAVLWAALLSVRPLQGLIPKGDIVDLILLLVVVPLFVATLLATGIFGYRWLAVVTLKTPEDYRGVVHFVCALTLASLYTFVDYNPWTALHRTVVYIDHNGFFALKLAAVVVFFAWFAHVYDTVDDEFPRFPLRWYGALTVGSIVVSVSLASDAESNAFHSYRYIAYYTGPVIAAYIGFFLGTSVFRRRRE